jgi:hypothetical protein
VQSHRRETSLGPFQEITNTAFDLQAERSLNEAINDFVGRAYAQKSDLETVILHP